MSAERLLRARRVAQNWKAPRPRVSRAERRSPWVAGRGRLCSDVHSEAYRRALSDLSACAISGTSVVGEVFHRIGTRAERLESRRGAPGRRRNGGPSRRGTSGLAGLSIQSIATALGRAPSTVSREIARNGGPTGAVAGRAYCTSVSGHRKRATARCPGTGREMLVFGKGISPIATFGRVLHRVLDADQRGPRPPSRRTPVADPLSAAVATLPKHLTRSLTWEHQMAQYARFTTATAIPSSVTASRHGSAAPTRTPRACSANTYRSGSTSAASSRPSATYLLRVAAL